MVHLEIFQVALDGRRISYHRDQIENCRYGRDPDSVILSHLAATGHAGEPRFVHSTSWRYEVDGSLVLTYLALVDAGVAEEAGLRPLGEPTTSLPVSGSPVRPRPREIREEQVIAHGLRHLAFLEREGQVITDQVGPQAGAWLQGLTPAPAGRIG